MNDSAIVNLKKQAAYKRKQLNLDIDQLAFLFVVDNKEIEDCENIEIENYDFNLLNSIISLYDQIIYAENDNSPIHFNTIKIRNKYKLSQSKFAKILNISQSGIWGYESNQAYPKKMVMEIYKNYKKIINR